jgi:hypothetical protein
VQNLEAHNFAVDWHLRFGGILGEKCLGRCPIPVHRCREFDRVGMAFLARILEQNPHVEGCLIFNFASDPKMQFSLKNWRKAILKTDQ